MNINCPVCLGRAVQIATLDSGTASPFICPDCGQGFQIGGTPDKWNRVAKKLPKDGHKCPLCLDECSMEDHKLIWRCNDSACNCLYYFMAVPAEAQH